MEAYQKIALHLHGLGEADSTWLLAQLPLQHSRILEQMLSELSDLGIPREATLLEDFHSEQSPLLEDKGGERDIPTEVERLMSVDVPLLLRVLSNESDEVVATVIAANNWPWAEVVLGLFQEERRQSIVQLFPSRKMVSEKVIASLLHALEIELQHEAQIIQNDLEQARLEKNSAALKRRKRRFVWQR